ncbi:hypothetical protein PR048_018314 [Dryococelus australis]|uniref:Uncharacterized protein n=1 Tax=Dryococelus australis TaxID=614101 RepID=A0ABQ9HCN2_9NEOP|nr:hypothetical protein PR048_018314 [Dryococelus australis]
MVGFWRVGAEGPTARIALEPGVSLDGPGDIAPTIRRHYLAALKSLSRQDDLTATWTGVTIPLSTLTSCGEVGSSGTTFWTATDAIWLTCGNLAKFDARNDIRGEDWGKRRVREYKLDIESSRDERRVQVVGRRWNIGRCVPKNYSCRIYYALGVRLQLTTEMPQYDEHLAQLPWGLTGETTPVIGKRKVILRRGDLRIKHNVCIAEIEDACHLGLDVLHRLGCCIDTRLGVLRVGSTELMVSTRHDLSSPINPSR